MPPSNDATTVLQIQMSRHSHKSAVIPIRKIFCCRAKAVISAGIYAWLSVSDGKTWGLEQTTSSTIFSFILSTELMRSTGVAILKVLIRIASFKLRFPTEVGPLITGGTTRKLELHLVSKILGSLTHIVLNKSYIRAMYAIKNRHTCYV